MITVKERFDRLYEINRSKFYSVIVPLNNKNDVKDILSLIKKEFPKANHYCYALKIDQYEKSNDDGEPSGTAGRPILELIKKMDLNQVIIIVVRYFGGIKLGASNLLRAYIEASKMVVESAKLFRVEEHKLYQIIIPYSIYDIVKNALSYKDGKIVNCEFNQDVIIDYLCFDFDENWLINLTNGNVKILSKGLQNVYINIES